MKTLIINGSPRPNGDTQAMIDLLQEQLNGEVQIINAYRCGISPCVDCRFCWENAACAIEDEMQKVYRDLISCDNVVIASPIYFSELTGQLLSVMSRMQLFFAAKHFRKQALIFTPKKGAVILVGGGDGNTKKPYETACTLLHHVCCDQIHPVVFSHQTNVRPATEDEEALRGIESIVSFFHSSK